MNPLTTLKVGQKYTFVKLGDFGFPFAAQLELVEVKVEPYAQYRETIVLIFKLKGKRKLRSIRVFDRDDYLVYEGWVSVNTEMYVETISETNEAKCMRSLRSFDMEYLYRAKQSVTQIPIIEKIAEKNN